MALAAYRHVLRSIGIAFKGDTRMLRGARTEARSKFEQSWSISTGSEDAVEAIEHAESVAAILRQNVVQGQEEDGNPDRYRLNIHDEIERGDNDTIKFAGKEMKQKAP